MEKKTTEESNYLKKIGLRIKENRNKIGLTQAELAEKMGTSDGQIRRVEQGGVNTSIVALKRMATLLEMAIDDLVKE